MVQDSLMCLLQEGFRKEDDENTCLQKSVDTLITVGRICRHALEMHKLNYAHLYEESEETESSVIAKMSNFCGFWIRALTIFGKYSPRPKWFAHHCPRISTCKPAYQDSCDSFSIEQTGNLFSRINGRDGARLYDVHVARTIPQGEDENTCLQKTVDTLVTVGRIVRRTREMQNRYNAKLSEESEETARSEIAKMANKVIKNYHRSTSLSDSLEYWRYLDYFYDPSRENDASVYLPF
ncbi:hypothetical protein CEXT_545861 [Caerostris extrusa]|uniref:Uncharacterized protein n=1 Tax=Caerostris extrusa TaxID=172846 RepID=A0AAV4QHA4_CAEEX|nr:hypothetical protein CEXT_545861 [Caerostris extrusa]